MNEASCMFVYDTRRAVSKRNAKETSAKQQRRGTTEIGNTRGTTAKGCRWNAAAKQ